MALDLSDPDTQAAVAAAAAELAKTQNTDQLTALQSSITALEGNNAKLVTEKKAEHDAARLLKDQIDALGGEEEIGKLQAARQEADKAAALQQLVDGNFDEFTSAITEKATAGLNKQLADALALNETTAGERDAMSDRYNSKLVDIDVRDAAVKAKVHPAAIEDIVARAQAQFTVVDDAIGVYDENGLRQVGKDGKQAYSPADWLEEQREAAPHWWPESQGGGAGGSQGGGNGGGTGNPWSAASWNMTAQGRVLREQGRDKADQLAKQANSSVGATAPTKAA